MYCHQPSVIDMMTPPPCVFTGVNEQSVLELFLIFARSRFYASCSVDSRSTTVPHRRHYSPYQARSASSPACC